MVYGQSRDGIVVAIEGAGVWLAFSAYRRPLSRQGEVCVKGDVDVGLALFVHQLGYISQPEGGDTYTALVAPQSVATGTAFITCKFTNGKVFVYKMKNDTDWQDDKGRIYIIYPIAEIAEILDKGSTTIKGALNELDMAGLLERERGGFSAPNRLYVKVPRVPQVQFSDQLMAGKPTLTEPENRPTDGQKTDLMMVGKPSPNQTTINNLTESQTKGVSGGPSAPYGRYGNIFLSQTEYDELQAEYPDRLERFIEEMSRYLAANGQLV